MARKKKQISKTNDHKPTETEKKEKKKKCNLWTRPNRMWHSSARGSTPNAYADDDSEQKQKKKTKKQQSTISLGPKIEETKKNITKIIDTARFAVDAK